MVPFSLRAVFAPEGRRPARRQLRVRVRPCFERLEDRVVLSTLRVGASEPYHTIQAAVNAARPGDAILVDPGTYQEQVVFGPTKSSITLQSVQPLAAVIQAPAVMASPKAIVEDRGARNVTVDGFTITGPGGGPVDSLEFGIRVDTQGSMTITDNHITHIHDSPFGGSQNGVGIFVGQSSSATISRNTIDNYQKGGIVVIGPGSSAGIDHNTVQGVGPTAVIAQNGIQVSNGAGATIDSNNISQNIFISPSTAAVGILLFSASQVIVSHNTVSQNDVGIYVLGTPGGGGQASITNNQISGSTEDGIDLDGATGVQVTGNTVTNSGADGIALFDNAMNNSISSNQSSGNGHDGIFVDSGSVNNSLSSNRMSNNTNLDAEDLSTGSGTGGTGNLWMRNECTTDNRGGALCR
jgi:parallel beta-helix repeat protein